MQKKTVCFSKNSSNLFFHILTKCNLSCSHCYINKEQHGENTLDIKTIKNWLRIFAKKNNGEKSIVKAKDKIYNKNLGNLIFLGGEPTLHPDLSKQNQTFFAATLSKS